MPNKDDKKKAKDTAPDPGTEKVVKFLGWVMKYVGFSSPWILPLLRVELFPDSFGWKMTATLAYLVGFIVAMAVHKRSAQKRMRWYVSIWFIALAIFASACFVAMEGFSFHWEVDADWEPLIYSIWLPVYWLVYVSLAFVLVLGSYLIVGNDA